MMYQNNPYKLINSTGTAMSEPPIMSNNQQINNNNNSDANYMNLDLKYLNQEYD